MKNRLLLSVLIFLVLGSLYAYEIGDRVLVDWSGDAYWYPATIVDENGSELFVIYDDSDREWVSPQQVAEENLSPGDQIECKWDGGDVFYTGIIAARKGDAVFIQYDDGDEEVSAINQLRILKP